MHVSGASWLSKRIVPWVHKGIDSIQNALECWLPLWCNGSVSSFARVWPRADRPRCFKILVQQPLKVWNSAKLCLLFGDGWLPLIYMTWACLRCTSSFADAITMRNVRYGKRTAHIFVLTPFAGMEWTHFARWPLPKADFSPKPCEHPETGKLAGKATSRTYSNTLEWAQHLLN